MRTDRENLQVLRSNRRVTVGFALPTCVPHMGLIYRRAEPHNSVIERIISRERKENVRNKQTGRLASGECALCCRVWRVEMNISMGLGRRGPISRRYYREAGAGPLPCRH